MRPRLAATLPRVLPAHPAADVLHAQALHPVADVGRRPVRDAVGRARSSSTCAGASRASGSCTSRTASCRRSPLPEPAVERSHATGSASSASSPSSRAPTCCSRRSPRSPRGRGRRGLPGAAVDPRREPRHGAGGVPGQVPGAARGRRRPGAAGRPVRPRRHRQADDARRLGGDPLDLVGNRPADGRGGLPARPAGDLQRHGRHVGEGHRRGQRPVLPPRRRRRAGRRDRAGCDHSRACGRSCAAGSPRCRRCASTLRIAQLALPATARVTRPGPTACTRRRAAAVRVSPTRSDEPGARRPGHARRHGTLATRLGGGALLVACPSGTEPEGALPVGRCADGRVLALLDPGTESSAATVSAQTFSRRLLAPLPAGERNRLSDTLARPVRRDGRVSLAARAARGPARAPARTMHARAETRADWCWTAFWRWTSAPSTWRDGQSTARRRSCASRPCRRRESASTWRRVPSAFRSPTYRPTSAPSTPPRRRRPGFLCFVELEGPSHLGQRVGDRDGERRRRGPGGVRARGPAGPVRRPRARAGRSGPRAPARRRADGEPRAARDRAAPGAGGGRRPDPRRGAVRGPRRRSRTSRS